MPTITLPSPAKRLTWRTHQKKDLISVAMNAIHVHLCDATPADLRCLAAAPELLALDDTILGALLNAHAACLKSGIWPAFDRSAPSTLDGFTPVYLEPWMTQGTSPTASFFAIGATPGGVPA